MIGRSPANSLIDPFFLGSPDQNDVQGYAGTPVNVNAYMFDFQADLGVAGAAFPRQQRFWVAVDSGADLHGRAAPRPIPAEDVEKRRHAPGRAADHDPRVGRPAAARRARARPPVRDRSLLARDRHTGRVLVGAAAYDPFAGLALFPLPGLAPRIRTGGPRRSCRSRRQPGDEERRDDREQPAAEHDASARSRITGVNGPAVAWLVPDAGACVTGPCAAGSGGELDRSGGFGQVLRRQAPDQEGDEGPGQPVRRRLADGKAGRGRHTLRATAVDRKGRSFSAVRRVRVCR